MLTCGQALLQRTNVNMSKTKSIYSCNECGAQSPKWVGQCPGCNAWNTLVETAVASKAMPERGWRFGAPSDDGDRAVAGYGVG